MTVHVIGLFLMTSDLTSHRARAAAVPPQLDAVGGFADETGLTAPEAVGMAVRPELWDDLPTLGHAIRHRAGVA